MTVYYFFSSIVFYVFRTRLLVKMMIELRKDDSV
jgi:hypothetical protein